MRAHLAALETGCSRLARGVAARGRPPCAAAAAVRCDPIAKVGAAGARALRLILPLEEGALPITLRLGAAKEHSANTFTSNYLANTPDMQTRAGMPRMPLNSDPRETLNVGLHLPALRSVLASSLAQGRPQVHITAGPSTSDGPSSWYCCGCCSSSPLALGLSCGVGARLLAVPPWKLKLLATLALPAGRSLRSRGLLYANSCAPDTSLAERKMLRPSPDALRVSHEAAKVIVIARVISKDALALVPLGCRVLYGHRGVACLLLSLGGNFQPASRILNNQISRGREPHLIVGEIQRAFKATVCTAPGQQQIGGISSTCMQCSHVLRPVPRLRFGATTRVFEEGHAPAMAAVLPRCQRLFALMPVSFTNGMMFAGVKVVPAASPFCVLRLLRNRTRAGGPVVFFRPEVRPGQLPPCN